MRILITNPETDAFTRYLLFWTNKMISEIKHNNTIYHLKNKNANPIKFSGILSKKDVNVVLLNGHGSDDCVMGENGIILDQQNVSLLKGKIVHAMSCSSAKNLGDLAVNSGARAYVGYDEPFLASRLDDKISNPLKDKTAALFLAPAFIAQKALANGKTPDEAVQLARNEYNRSILKALTSPIQSDDDQFVGLLLWDRNHLVAKTKTP